LEEEKNQRDEDVVISP